MNGERAGMNGEHDAGMDGERDAEEYTDLRLDGRAIRTLAHPLRSRLLTRLRIDGPATATELAHALQTNTGATSYHLRALESVGLVTDTGAGAGRRRVWRASTDAHSWAPSAVRDDPDAQAALGWLSRDYIHQAAERALRWEDAADAWPAEWVDAVGFADSFVTVTAAQAAALMTELAGVLDRYRHAGEHDRAARRVHITLMTSPQQLDPPDPAR